MGADFSNNHKFHEGDRRACSVIVFIIYTKIQLKSLCFLCIKQTDWRRHQGSIVLQESPWNRRASGPARAQHATIF